MKYMVDTCVFNWLLDGALAVEDLPAEAAFVSTHVQHDELNSTRNPERRAKLLSVFAETVREHVATSSTVLGVSRVGLCRLGDGSTFESIRAALNQRNNGKANNSQDALIAETALREGFSLVTADRDLAVVAENHGCNVMLVESTTDS